MRARAAAPALAAALAGLLAGGPPAGAQGFEDVGSALGTRGERAVRWSGTLRARGELLYNLDLDRGLTPSGAPLFPVPLADPTGQLLTHADLRARTDVTLLGPNGGVAVHLRVDLFDGAALGSSPDGPPTAATGQTPSPVALRVKRAWGEALTPFGVLAAGRMGSQWGLGMLTHGGDCFGCDSGDAADRLAFVTPIAGHLWALAWDFTAVGPTVARRDEARVVDVDPSDDVRTLTFAVMAWRPEWARDRRRRAGRTTVDYGAYVSHRWQRNDVPATYVATADPAPLTRAQVMERGFRATAVDGWLRVTAPRLRVEAEAAFLAGRYEQASLVPGVLLARAVEARQWGLAVQSDVGAPEAPLGAGLDLGAASGDPAFGFGVRQVLGDSLPRAGDLDGPQARPPNDTRFDNFRFHPDYRVDQILFRELVGTVTDAVYLRPHARWRVAPFGGGALTAEIAVVASWALEATSTPGGERPLGVELDPSLRYESDDGFRADLDYALLLPLGGLDNPAAGLSARPAQLVRLSLGYLF